MSKVKIEEVKVSVTQKGKNSYSMAECTFSNERGEGNKVKKVMSFSNPAVFEIVSKIKSPTWVEIENDGAPYYNWSSMKLVNDEPVDVVKAPSFGKVIGSTYETADERKAKQLLIVRQSSISNAIEYLKQSEDVQWNVQNVLDIAQEFVDYVYGTQEVLAKGSEDA